MKEQKRRVISEHSRCSSTSTSRKTSASSSSSAAGKVRTKTELTSDDAEEIGHGALSVSMKPTSIRKFDRLAARMNATRETTAEMIVADSNSVADTEKFKTPQ
ncbi:hypothetical protein SeLEV6574_g06831 [Synchytrium endobioticum]|uniref:Uncharacterized protein n=1 Tax=Synchytrium endobioticum TaxID=286115 RepID=A0A507CMM2_9FUNG|nr:hypothetical protein SeLEV6574_g06831 [Synchytrium endobioticum]